MQLLKHFQPCETPYVLRGFAVRRCLRFLTPQTDLSVLGRFKLVTSSPYFINHHQAIILRLTIWKKIRIFKVI